MNRHIQILTVLAQNLLCKSALESYGHYNLEDVAHRSTELANRHVVATELLQSNYMGQVIDWIKPTRDVSVPAFAHNSVAILVALNGLRTIILKTHISNLHKHEDYHHYSYISLCTGRLLAGLGIKGYRMFARRMAGYLA